MRLQQKGCGTDYLGVVFVFADLVQGVGDGVGIPAACFPRFGFHVVVQQVPDFALEHVHTGLSERLHQRSNIPWCRLGVQQLEEPGTDRVGDPGVFHDFPPGPQRHTASHG